LKFPTGSSFSFTFVLYKFIEKDLEAPQAAGESSFFASFGFGRAANADDRKMNPGICRDSLQRKK